MIRQQDGSVDLELDCTADELVEAMRQVQGRARTHLMDDLERRALAGMVLEQLGRARMAAAAAGLTLDEASPSAAWCWTGSSLLDGVHTQVRLYPGGLSVFRGPLRTTGISGTVYLSIPQPKRAS